MIVNLKLEDDYEETISIGEALYELSDIRSNIIDLDVRYSLESLQIDKELYIDTIIVGEENIIGDIFKGIWNLIKKVVDFFVKMAKAVWSAIKRFFRFIANLFKSDKSDGGGGSVRERIENKKEAIDKEIDEVFKNKTDDAVFKKAYDNLKEKYLKEIAGSLYATPTFFYMPGINIDNIQPSDIYNYISTYTASFSNTTALNFLVYLSDSSNNPAINIIQNDNFKSLLTVLVSLYKVYEKKNETALTILDVTDRSNIEKYIDNLLLLLINFNKTLTEQLNSDFEYRALSFNNKSIDIPDDIKKDYNNDIFKRFILFGIKTKSFIMLIIEFLSDGIEKINKSKDTIVNMLRDGDTNVSYEEFLLELTNLLVYSIELQNITIVDRPLDVKYTEEYILKHLNNFNVSLADVNSYKSEIDKLLYETQKDFTQELKINEKIIETHESKFNDILQIVVDLENSLKRILKDNNIGNISKEGINNLRGSFTNITKIVRGVNVNTLGAYKQYIKVGSSVASENIRLINAIGKDIKSKQKDARTIYDIIINMYGIAKLEDYKD